MDVKHGSLCLQLLKNAQPGKSTDDDDDDDASNKRHLTITDEKVWEGCCA